MNSNTWSISTDAVLPTASELYLLNCWYMASWAGELEPGAHMKRVLLGKPVLLMRAEGGDVAAIGNVCPHRFASLSDGRFEAGAIECRYHGLRFDMSGRCIGNPQGGEGIPARARVPSYPVVERHGAIWIWFGTPEAADPALIPDLSFLDATSAGQRAPGYLCIKANYQLMSDNILDLSHADFLHPTTLGAGGEISKSRPKARMLDDVFTIEWSFDGKGMVMQRPIWNGAELHTKFHVTWYPPAVMVLRSEVGPVGRGGLGNRTAGVHVMTPQTAKSTHYFFESGEARKRANLVSVHVRRDNHDEVA